MIKFTRGNLRSMARLSAIARMDVNQQYDDACALMGNDEGAHNAAYDMTAVKHDMVTKMNSAIVNVVCLSTSGNFSPSDYRELVEEEARKLGWDGKAPVV